MLKHICILLVLMFVLSSCKRDNDNDQPPCLNSRISEFRKSPICADARVDEYVFKQKSVYVFEPGNCIADGASEVTDDHCNTLGYLGGFTGNMTIEGENFQSAILIRTVWKNR